MSVCTCELAGPLCGVTLLGCEVRGHGDDGTVYRRLEVGLGILNEQAVWSQDQ
jgi:hypothetical protein